MESVRPVQPSNPDARGALDLWRAVTARTLDAFGPDLSARQTAILLTIHLDPGPHTVRGLAAGLGIGKPAVTRALNALEAQDLVRREPDPADRRNVFLTRTEAGAARLADMAALIAAGASAALSPTLPAPLAPANRFRHIAPLTGPSARHPTDAGVAQG
jgi:DNA-binding MarR family transcriptional regulator